MKCAHLESHRRVGCGDCGATVVTVTAAVIVVLIVMTMPATVISWYLQLGTRCTPTTSGRSLANEFFQALFDLRQQPSSSFRATGPARQIDKAARGTQVAVCSCALGLHIPRHIASDYFARVAPNLTCAVTVQSLHRHFIISVQVVCG